jgi:hypothetical protein
MAWANVQRVDNRATAATTTTITITAATAGNLLISCIGVDKNSGAITIPTGWTRIGTDYVQTSVSFAYAYFIAAGGETSVVWNWVTSQTSTSWCGEYSGLTSTPLDVNTRNSSVDTAVTTLSTNTTGTTAQADELAMVFMASDTWTTTEVTRTWTNSFSEVSYNIGTGSSRPGLSIAEKDLTATGTVESTFACVDTGDQMVCVVATFKESGGAVAIKSKSRYIRQAVNRASTY